MKNKKLFLPAILTIVAVIFSSSWLEAATIPPCAHKVSIASQKLVYTDLKEWPLEIEVPAINDIRCEDNEVMANVVIVAKLKKGSIYAIFHIHFSPDGKLISAAKFTEWKNLKNKDQWLYDWCSILRSTGMYQNDLKNQKCE